MINKYPKIILINPQLPENIGMSARAMMNCGFNDLRIVNPREHWPNQIAINSSVHAKKIVKNIKVFDNFNESVSDLNFLIATTVRKRFLRKEHYFDFSDLAKSLPTFSKVGIIFGPENSGLTNKHISKCDCIFSIPLLVKNSSLNLSHSVLIVCYEFARLFNKNYKSNSKIDAAPRKEFNNLMKKLYIDLLDSGFLYPIEKSEGMFLNIQNMFLRAKFSSQEISTFMGILKKLKKPRIN